MMAMVQITPACHVYQKFTAPGLDPHRTSNEQQWLKKRNRMIPTFQSLSIFNLWQPRRIISMSASLSSNENVAAILLGDGLETNLWPLTKRRSASAIPIGANFRLIDVVVSNCIHSNITKIFALTQLNSTSLNSHLYGAYSKMGLRDDDDFLQVIASCQSPEYRDWSQGNADSMRRCLALLEEYHPVSEFLILPGHQLYKMDYNNLIQAHRLTNADITISSLKTTDDRNGGFGILKVDSLNRVVEVKETLRDQVANQADIIRESAYRNLTSMGIYVIKGELISKMLRQYFTKAKDFRTEVIPGAMSLGMKVRAYEFKGYWENMGSIKSFFGSSIGITRRTQTGFDFYDRQSPVFTLPRNVPPTKVNGTVIIRDSVIGDGCVLNSCIIRGSVLGLRSRIGERAVIEDSIIMGSNAYEDNAKNTISAMNGKATSVSIPIGVGEDSVIRKTIVDKNARIGKQVLIINGDKVQEGNREEQGYVIKDGIVVVMRNAVIPNGAIL